MADDCILNCEFLNIATRHTPLYPATTGKKVRIDAPGSIQRLPAGKKYLLAKRVFDLFFSLIVIVTVMSWLTPLLGAMIKLNSNGPVLFRQKRLGKNGIPFFCLMFRTMIVNEEADDRPALEIDERITGVGKFLRRCHIDKLPQFFNVLKGEMSIVGPQPHMITDCIRFSFVISSYSFRSLVRPGITGWAQVNGYHGPTSDYDSIIIRYYWDAMYIRKFAFLLDLKIICNTIKKGSSNLYRQIISFFFSIPSIPTNNSLS